MDDLTRWLALVRAPGLGAVRAQGLLDRYGSITNLFDAGRAALSNSGVAPQAIDGLLEPDLAAIERDRGWLAQPGRALIWRGHEHYPRLLCEVAGAPVALFVDGDPALLAEPQLAIVGSRNPTRAGAETAHAFAAQIARYGLIVTSGLAAGIDAAAHTGALDAGAPTIAVCGTGLDTVYPAAHGALAREIRTRGAMVSEFPPGTTARREHFPQRNRIIAALSLGTLVVEAAQRSGALITAHRAIEYGREVFAIPGSIHNPLARGCHRLIREGAKLVESAGDILVELGAVATVSETGQAPAAPADDAAEVLDDDYAKLLECIGWEPTAVDTLVVRSGLTAHEVSSMLLILELRGFVSPAPQGGFSRTRKSLNK